MAHFANGRFGFKPVEFNDDTNKQKQPPLKEATTVNVTQEDITTTDEGKLRLLILNELTNQTTPETQTEPKQDK
jgi:hypothetical protein